MKAVVMDKEVWLEEFEVIGVMPEIGVKTIAIIHLCCNALSE